LVPNEDLKWQHIEVSKLRFSVTGKSDKRRYSMICDGKTDSTAKNARVFDVSVKVLI